jgi:hypothetical protein
LLDELATGELTRSIPVVMVTSQLLSASERERLGIRAAAVLQKGELDRQSVQHMLVSIGEGSALSGLNPAV